VVFLTPEEGKETREAGVIEIEFAVEYAERPTQRLLK
jgi:hypothetical protein